MEVVRRIWETDMTHRYHVDTQRLKGAREKAGLTVARLVSRTGIDAHQLLLVEERGYVPALTTLRRITLALEIPAHTVIKWEPAPFTWETSRRSA
jgi:transcriptional regulator with XRE-family HTH domain